MSEFAWSALIYTRTYRVDYHYVVKPTDFGEDEIAWLESYLAEILSATNRQYGAHPPVGLLHRFMLSSKQHWVIGILCDVPSLLDDQERQALADKFLSSEVSKGRDLSRDEADRRIAYMRLAYVIRKNGGKQIPPINFDIGIFKPLYEHVAQRWLIPYKKPAETIDYRSDRDSIQRILATEVEFSDLPALNTNPDHLSLYPNDNSYPKSLWYSFSFCDAPTSLLISKVGDESLKTGQFMNASLPNITVPTLFKRQDSVEVPVKQVQLQSTEASQNISDTFTSFLSSLLSSGDVREAPKVILQKLEELEQQQRINLGKYGELEQRIRKLEETPPQDYQSSRGTEDSPPSVSSVEKMIEELLQILQRYRELEQLVNKQETENQARN